MRGNATKLKALAAEVETEKAVQKVGQVAQKLLEMAKDTEVAQERTEESSTRARSLVSKMESASGPKAAKLRAQLHIF